MASISIWRISILSATLGDRDYEKTKLLQNEIWQAKNQRMALGNEADDAKAHQLQGSPRLPSLARSHAPTAGRRRSRPSARWDRRSDGTAFRHLGGEEVAQLPRAAMCSGVGLNTPPPHSVGPFISNTRDEKCPGVHGDMGGVVRRGVGRRGGPRQLDSRTPDPASVSRKS